MTLRVRGPLIRPPPVSVSVHTLSRVSLYVRGLRVEILLIEQRWLDDLALVLSRVDGKAHQLQGRYNRARTTDHRLVLLPKHLNAITCQPEDYEMPECFPGTCLWPLLDKATAISARLRPYPVYTCIISLMTRCDTSPQHKPGGSGPLQSSSFSHTMEAALL